MNQCEATRASGDRCRAQALPGRPKCFAHDEDNRELANAARRKGGQNSGNVVRAARRIPRDMSDLVKRLLEAVDAVERGDLDHRRATAMASLAGAAVRVYEVGEVQQRLETLEARLEAEQPRAKWR